MIVDQAFRLDTQRLVLRDWSDGDAADFHKVCADPRVMATIGPILSLDETGSLITEFRKKSEQLGHTFWAMELKECARVIGFTGLKRGTVPAIQDQLEIGWRLAADCWGQGYATEAARATLDWAHANRPGEPVIAITAATNRRSRKLMERLGMQYRPGRDFEHPAVPPGDPLRSHVVYEKECHR